MGRFHRHDDGTAHHHEHAHSDHHHHEDGTVHSHEHGDLDHHHHEDGTVHSHEYDDPGHHHHEDGTVHSHEDAHPGHHHHDDGTVHVHENDYEGHRHDREIDPELIGDHSKYETGRERIEILEDIFAENDHRAAHNRALFDTHDVHCVNLMSSPGAGKTSILERTLDELSGKVRVGIVEGDVETPLDSDRLAGRGAQISLLNTGDGFGGECHLDAPMVAHALKSLDLSQLDLVVIENVGNLVCPAEFEVGEHRKAMVYAITEGEDKPVKYPVMFRAVEAVLVNKMDLKPYLDFDYELFEKYLRQVNPDAVVIPVSAKTGEGINQWIDWLTSPIS